MTTTNNPIAHLIGTNVVARYTDENGVVQYDRCTVEHHDEYNEYPEILVPSHCRIVWGGDSATVWDGEDNGFKTLPDGWLSIVDGNFGEVEFIPEDQFQA